MTTLKKHANESTVISDYPAVIKYIETELRGDISKGLGKNDKNAIKKVKEIGKILGIDIDTPADRKNNKLNFTVSRRK